MIQDDQLIIYLTSTEKVSIIWGGFISDVLGADFEGRFQWVIVKSDWRAQLIYLNIITFMHNIYSLITKLRKWFISNIIENPTNVCPCVVVFRTSLFHLLRGVFYSSKQIFR